MDSESKRLKNENEMKSNSSSNSKKSLLSEDILSILLTGSRDGFINGVLILNSNATNEIRKINDRMMPEICEWVAKLNGKVEYLNLAANKITSTGASMLFNTLRTSNSCIKQINLMSNKNIDDKCMKSLGECINSNKNIQDIKIGNASISDVGIEILAPYLEGNTTFKSLLLTENKGVTDKSIRTLIKMIESSYIESIKCSLTSITQKNLIFVPLACNSIKCGNDKLNCWYESLNDTDLMKICDAMRKHGIDKLKEINFDYNKITSKGASVLLDTLKECNSVVSNLDLSKNQLDDECMDSLGQFVQSSQHLEKLTMKNNKITDKGIKILSDKFTPCTRLKEFNIDGNLSVTDVSVLSIVEIIMKSYITEFNVESTSVSEEKRQVIKSACKIPIDEREISIKR